MNEQERVFSPVATLPVFVGMSFDEGDYAKLQQRLDFYQDMIVATRYQDGKAEETFVVDPLAVAQALTGVTISSGMLPENLLFWQKQNGQERVGYWLPPQVWHLRVEPTDKVNRMIPLPGMVLIGRGKEYRLFALDTNERPGPDTPLYNPPCPNVSGNVCHGNVPFPEAGAETIVEATNLFFESGFNGHLAQGKSKKHPENILAMWRVLHRAKATDYPIDDLVLIRGLTLAMLMRR